jgi:hypothetical protein
MMQTSIDPTNSDEFQKYLSLWKQGLFLLQSRSLAEEFSTARESKQKPRFDSVLRSNYLRMKVEIYLLDLAIILSPK